VWVDSPGGQAGGELFGILKQQLHDFDISLATPAAGRLRVARGLEHEAATRLAAALAARGVKVAVEPHLPDGEEILSLDEFDAADAQPDATAATADGGLALQLVSLDGDDGAGAPAPVMPSRLPPPIEPVSEAADDVRFRPPSEDAIAAELQLDAPAPRTSFPCASAGSSHGAAASSHGSAASASHGSAASASHGSASYGSASAVEDASSPALEGRPYPHPAHEADEDVAVEAPLPGWRGQLRARPPLRIGAGMALGLLLGYALSQPYANRAERRVAELRAEADRERYMSAEDAQRRVAALDEQADAQAGRAAAGAGAIWLAVAGLTFAGWWKST
jgi:hypothetical protein